jgi:hypothetical protein
VSQLQVAMNIVVTIFIVVGAGKPDERVQQSARARCAGRRLSDDRHSNPLTFSKYLISLLSETERFGEAYEVLRILYVPTNPQQKLVGRNLKQVKRVKGEKMCGCIEFPRSGW